MSIELGAEKWDILRNTICGISTSQLVAWRKGTAGKVVVVPFLSHSLLLIFFPIHLTSEDVKEKKSIWYTVLGELPIPAPEIPPLQRTVCFPSTLSTSFKRHLNIGDFWRYCQNKCILTTALLAQIPDPPFPHCGSIGKRLNSLY